MGLSMFPGNGSAGGPSGGNSGHNGHKRRASALAPGFGGNAPRAGEVAVQESSDRYREIFNNLDEGVFLFGITADGAPGRILEANRSFCQLLGYEHARLVGMPVQEIGDPVKLQGLITLLSRKATGEPQRFETALRRKTRKDVSVELTAHLYRSAGDRVVLAIARDISARKLDTETLQRLAAIVESSEDGIIGKTLDGMITSWNSGAKNLYGYDAEEVLGRHVSMLKAPDSGEDMNKVLDRLRRGERIEHYETVRMTKDGRRIDISLTLSPIRDSTGKVIGASATERDITKRKQIEAEREKLLAELQDALARVKALHGLLPICAWCKRVRDDQGYWKEVETYIREHADVDFSHGICPDCEAKVMKEHFRNRGH